MAPVEATTRLANFIRAARRSLDITSELLGNPTLESELAAAAARGVRVRLIAPAEVNGATGDGQALQTASLHSLAAAGLDVHVTRPPETAQTPYMHARMAIVDGERAYLGSVSLSPDSATANRGVGIILRTRSVVNQLQNQFDADFRARSQPLTLGPTKP